MKLKVDLNLVVREQNCKFEAIRGQMPKRHVTPTYAQNNPMLPSEIFKVKYVKKCSKFHVLTLFSLRAVRYKSNNQTPANTRH